MLIFLNGGFIELFRDNVGINKDIFGRLVLLWRVVGIK